MRGMTRGLGAVLLVCGVSGCGPEVPREELGTIIYEVPEFHPEDEKFDLPQLGDPPAAADEAVHDHAGHDHHGHDHSHDGHDHDHDH